jgi:RNA polymerase sigma factor, sigma-70 family
MIDNEEDKSKFELIYSQYRQLMFYIANEILHDKHLAEDAVQQAFLKTIDNLQKIHDVNCPQTKSYIVIITRSVSLDMLRHRNRHRNLSFEEIEDNEDLTEDFSLTLEGRTDYQILISAIQSLPQNYKNVLLLKYVHEYSTQEISKALGLSLENAKKILQRARKKLEQILREEGVLE